MHVFKWNAKRSGAAMTVEGFDLVEGGKPVKLSNVKKIEQRRRRTVAILANGDEYILRNDH